MARERKVNFKKINSKLDLVDKTMDDIFKQTYYYDRSSQASLDKIVDDIEHTIAHSNAKKQDAQGLADITRLYTRMNVSNNKDIQAATKILSDSGNIFDDANLMSAMDIYSQTRWLRDMDKEIDMILKYFPELRTALNLKKDNVLSADNFTKEYVNISSASNVITSNTEKMAMSAKFEYIKEKYKLNTLFDEMYDDAATYGEYFLYIVPYKKAFSTLLNRRNRLGLASNKDGSMQYNKAYIRETGEVTRVTGKAYTENGRGGITLSVNPTCILDKVVMNHAKIAQIATSINLQESVYTNWDDIPLNEATIKEIKKNETSFDKTVTDNLEFEDFSTPISQDGLYSASQDSTSENQIKVPGCILKKLCRYDVLPLYIENICLGYYYIEIDTQVFNNTVGNLDSGYFSSQRVASSTGGGAKSVNQFNAQANDGILKKISAAISQHIDKAFINSNQDLSEEIYSILKYNEKMNISDLQSCNINVSFLPPDDVVHFKFKDIKDTHRGMPDLWYSIWPAKMYIMLQLATQLGILTRSVDRRVYYVKQTGIDGNVAQSMMNVILQIKKGNFGIRQIESINHILGILGKFTDFVIPVGPSGDPPIDMQVMQGQQFDTPSDLLDRSKEAALGATDVPMELVQAVKSMDYAIHYSMSNSRFFDIVMKRQVICQQFYSRIVTKIYNAEYDTKDILEVTLPAPRFLSMTNGSQLVQNTIDFTQNAVEGMFPMESDEVKAIVRQKYFRYHIGTHINAAIFDKFLEEAKLEVSAKSQSQGEE